MHLDLDSAWPPGVLGLPRREALAWGPRLRVFAKQDAIDAFDEQVMNDLPPFVVYGSGDFHHLTAVLLRRMRSPVTLVAFDNHPAERYPRLSDAMTRENWRSRFESFASSLAGDVYLTVDMDCLREEDAVTNWESGLFAADDVAWAISRLPRVIAGDVCGAYSPPVYERGLQRFAAEWDHPRLGPRENARAINTRSLEKIWPRLAGRH